MKKFPTALAVPRISFRLWLKMAPPLAAIVPALGSAWGVALGAGAASSDGCDRAAEVEEAGVDAVPFQKTLDVDELRLERVAQRRRLLGDGGAAEKDNAGQHARDHQADHRQPQRMRQPHHAPEQVAHGVEGDAEQDAGKYQKQRRGELPGEREQGGEQHDADAADRYRPRQIVAGLKAIVSRTCHVDSFSQDILRRQSFAKIAAGIKRERTRRFDAATLRYAKRCMNLIWRAGEDEMNFKWFGPLALLAALVIGDQIRINRPAHKYRLTVEVETPEGRKSASGVVAVHPDRSYTRRGQTRTLGDAVFVDLGQGKNLVALLAHIDNNKLELDGINYVALRAYTAAAGGKRVSFNAMSAQTGIVPVKAELVPVLVSFADPANPASARAVAPDDAEAVLGKGYRLQGITAEVVPNGFWPIDFGGMLGEPVTRGIVAKLPWLNGADHPAANALRAAGLPGVDGIDAREAFTRK